MYIFSQDKERFVNSNNISSIFISHDALNVYDIMADDFGIAVYSNLDDAKKELNSIFRQLEAGATSYQVR